MDKQILEKKKEVESPVVWRKLLFWSLGGTKNVILLVGFQTSPVRPPGKCNMLTEILQR